MFTVSARMITRMTGVALLVLAPAAPAVAGIIFPTPGPMIGAGVPALAVFGAGYWLIRRRKRG
jgi:hypothetical protein